MGVESEISSVLSLDSVNNVSFSEDTNRVEVLYDSHELFKDWPHGDDEGTHDQQEKYFQEKFGVDWSLVEIDMGSTKGRMTDQLAIFER